MCDAYFSLFRATYAAFIKCIYVQYRVLKTNIRPTDNIILGHRAIHTIYLVFWAAIITFSVLIL